MSTFEDRNTWPLLLSLMLVLLLWWGFLLKHQCLADSLYTCYTVSFESLKESVFVACLFWQYKPRVQASRMEPDGSICFCLFLLLIVNGILDMFLHNWKPEFSKLCKLQGQHQPFSKHHLLVLPNMDLGMLTQHTAKSVYWHWIVVNESTAFIANVKQGEWAVCTQKTWTPQWLFGEGFLKVTLQEWVAGCPRSFWIFFWLVVG